jgi:hypothetical protein
VRRALPWLFGALALIVAYFLFKSAGKSGSVAQPKSKFSGTLDSITGITKSVTGLVGTIQGAFGSAPPPAANVAQIKAPASYQAYVPSPANSFQDSDTGPGGILGSGGLAGDILTSGD